MAKDRFGDVVVGTIGDAAASVADPKEGWARFRSKALSPVLMGVGVALVAGYLFGRRCG
ncbi:hypothetical protein [Plantactinospora sp. GCM10030261]|uniref:hypothetical protein n=1 Tax=Plantactinospora sp. GCM10030261 TaxID=3273420 RepID=UPI00360BF46C